MLMLGHRVRSHLSIFRNFWKPLLKYKKHVVYYGTHFSIRCRSIPPFASLSKLHDIKQCSAGWGILSAVPPDYRLSLLGRFWMPYTSECSIRRPFEQTRVIIPHALGAKQWSLGRTMRYGVPWDHCLTSLGQIHSAVFLVTDCSILVPPGQTFVIIRKATGCTSMINGTQYSIRRPTGPPFGITRPASRCQLGNIARNGMFYLLSLKTNVCHL